MPRLATTLLGILLLTGCSGTPTVVSPTASTASTPASTSGTSTAASPAETPMPLPSANVQVIEISLKDGKVTPNGDRIALTKGTILRLKITSDRDDEVHVHGYDVEIPVRSGASVTKDITLEQVGRFEIESHDPQFTIVQLVVS